jgi:hypothetical protein
MSIISPTSSVSNSGKQHAHLLREFYGIDGGTPDQQDSPSTLLSRKFDGAQSLFEVSARLADGKLLLNDALSTITNEHATTKMTNIASTLPIMLLQTSTMLVELEKSRHVIWARYLPSARNSTSRQQLNIFHHQTTC